MSEFRQDPILGRWVIVATERAAKPEELVQQARTEQVTSCPFCEGEESDTTSEVMAVRDSTSNPNGPGWRVRVIPNKYPALRTDGGAENGDVGVHDVIIECPQHETNLAHLPDEQVRDVLTIYRDRLIGLGEDRRLAYGLLFKNSGALAGASMGHCHSQLLSMPVVPQLVAEELAGSERHFQQTGACPYCEMLEREFEEKSRLVFSTDNYALICPYASRFPFEMCLLPREHKSRFEEQSTEQLQELAHVLKTALNRLGSALDQPAYNYYLHTAPLHAGSLPHYHWHLEIFPRLAQLAGFELGGSMFINPLPPERATEILAAAGEQ